MNFRLFHRFWNSNEVNEVDNIKLNTNIGIGAFGTVWSCGYQDQKFACKILNKNRMKDDDRKLIENEISIWKSICHVNIIRLHFVFFKGPKIYCICDLMDESLYDMHLRMIKIGSKPRVITIIKQMIQICDAMVYLHSINILHRDLKSTNILRRGEIMMVSDFGLARFCATEMTAETGSYRWMAPEIVKHENYDRSCDVYSFSMLQYEMMTLCVPFASYSPIEVAFGVARGKRPVLPPVPDEMKNLIEDCWNHDKQLRPEFPEILDRLSVMRDKKSSYGCLEMASKPMKRIESYDCIF